MVKVIMGVKGSGKTKQLIELVKKAVDEEHGAVVCIENVPTLTYDIPYTVRLIETAQYGFTNYDYFKGFISGLHAGNYDITHIFIDSLFKIIDTQLGPDTEGFLDWCEALSNRENIKFTVMISADKALATDNIKKFF